MTGRALDHKHLTPNVLVRGLCRSHTEAHTEARAEAKPRPPPSRRRWGPAPLQREVSV